MRIGLDLDGVVANWVRAVNETLIQFRAAKLDPTFEPDSWDWFQENLSVEDWQFIWRGGSHHIFETARPYEGARKFVADLYELGDIVVMTARPKNVWNTTRRWWDLNFGPEIPAGFNFFYSGKSKGLVEVDVLIEDSYEYSHAYLDRCEARGNYESQVYLLDRPWNRAYNCRYRDNLYAVENYAEILALLKRRKENENVK